MSLLELSKVSKAFNGSPVLCDVDLCIARGEFVAIVGFSGAGKTTLISLIAGLLRPDSGEVRLEGRPVTGPGPDRGIVFQNYSLLPWLTVYENIALAVDQVNPAWDATRRREQVERHIAMVNLTPARDKKPSELSGGMRQRVSVARALAMDPQILLLDEPLGALDALTRATLQDEISRIREETHKTVVLITNDPDEGIYLADRIIPLTAGPGATLGPSFTIDIPRPRNRKEINHDPHFKQLRRDVTEFLLASRHRPHATVTRKLVLPDIEPEDLNLPRSPQGGRRLPRRSHEIREEKVEIE
ncbi:MAG TPA: nitrate ABC transporter ATP-binding protein [Verrucomicrobiales bacterium]|nr:nitrate ABC transporter ATP-binding protein [Verrucomicrobiales bacterium]